ncbi:MAG: class I SAM-dependent methyltransferase [Chloroflexi bacterium]|nr:class I SAM-dependent methyltransferase [Chloroflexota bacterium]
MNLSDILDHRSPPEPWSEGDNIPWNDVDFSRRMLREHLTQSHDLASRRSEKIVAHVDWIHRELLSGNPTAVLDLGCGPGLYASRFVRQGQRCVGIDFSPTSIEYARAQADAERLPVDYIQADIRAADYGTDFGIVMLIFGEFNVFKPTDAAHILRKAYASLSAGGRLLLEAHDYDAIRQFGSRPVSWYAAESGLFSDSPHICLQENFWDANIAAVTRRYFIVDAATGEVTRYAQSLKAYTADEYRAALQAAGFCEVRFYPSLHGEKDPSQSDLLAISARK